MFNKTIIPLVFIFLIFGACILVFRNQLEQNGIDWQMLSGANLFIYVITVISMHLLTKGMNASNTHSFLRNAYGGILVKLMACAVAAFIYILVSGNNLNKPALLISMGFYLVYSFVEHYVLLKESNRKKNVKN
jgi:high-affinity Fe2+/Pb2+ permease